MNRRAFLTTLGAGGLIAMVPSWVMARPMLELTASQDIEPLELSDKAWRKKLSSQQFEVLRKADTERSGSSVLNQEKREGAYHCSGCDLPLFESAMKYESGTGWPSFFDHIKGRLLVERDIVLFIPRTEYHCARCGGHQGHVFGDGPKPTGLRWCNNGVALNFKPVKT